MRALTHTHTQCQKVILKCQFAVEDSTRAYLLFTVCHTMLDLNFILYKQVK